eukprot:9371567-Alexandrium_andersonii.AAC.1
MVPPLIVRRSVVPTWEPLAPLPQYSFAAILSMVSPPISPRPVVPTWAPAAPMPPERSAGILSMTVSYTHLRAHETSAHL